MRGRARKFDVEVPDGAKPVFIDEAKRVKYYFDIEIGKGQKTDDGPLRLRMGDLITVRVDKRSGAMPSPRHKNQHKNNRWFPYDGPWSSGQVVGIYQNMDDNMNQWSIMLRWFYRTTEYDIQSLPNIKDHSDDLEDVRLLLKDCDELYECDDVVEIKPNRVLDHFYIHNSGQSINCIEQNKKNLNYCCRRFLSLVNDDITMHAIRLNGKSSSWEYERELTAFELGRVQSERNLTMLRRVVRGLRCVPLWRNNESACFNVIRHVCDFLNSLGNHEIELKESLYYSSSDDTDYSHEVSEDITQSQPYKKYVEKQIKLTKSRKKKTNKPKEVGKKEKVPVAKKSVPRKHMIKEEVGRRSTKAIRSLKHTHIFSEPPNKERRNLYYSSIQLPSQKGLTWNIHVGEAICVDCPDYFKTRSTKNKNQWQPFKKPWRPAQIVAIYHSCNGQHNALPANIPLDQLYVEIRWLYRPSDTGQEIAHELEYTAKKNSLEEVYETEVLEVVHAVRVMGKIVLLGDKDTKNQLFQMTVTTTKEPCGTPILKHLCTKFYAHKEKVLIDLPHQGIKSSIERGLKLSAKIGMLRDRQHSIDQLYKALEINIPDSESVSASDTDSKSQVFRKLPFDTTLNKKDGSVLCNLEYFSYASIPLSWSNYHLADVICNQSERIPGWRWTFSAGDYVALYSDSSNKPENSSSVKKAGGQIWYPFNVAWSACQILSIYRYKEDSDNDIKMRIRWLYRSTDFKKAKCPSLEGWRRDTICNTDHLDEVSFDSILGPIELKFKDEKYMSGKYSSIPAKLRRILSVSLQCFSSDYYTNTNNWRNAKKNENARFIDHFRKAMKWAGFSNITIPSIKDYMGWLENERKIIKESMKEIEVINPRCVITKTDSTSDNHFETNIKSVTYDSPIKQKTNGRENSIPINVDSPASSSKVIYCSSASKDDTEKFGIQDDMSNQSYPSKELFPIKKKQVIRSDYPPSFYKNDNVKENVSKILDLETKSLKRGRKRKSQILSPIYENRYKACKTNVMIVSDENSDIFSKCADFLGMKTEPNIKDDIETDAITSVSPSFVEKEFENQEDSDEVEALVSTIPFHVNISSQKAYFSEIRILPPYDNYTDLYKTSREHYENNLEGTDSNSDMWWKICLGDTVAVHSNLLVRKCDIKYNVKSQFPFAVDWWAGEVVSIWQNVPSLELAQNLRRKSEKCSFQCEKEEETRIRGDFCLEIRWFYRTTDIPGGTTGLNKTGPISTLRMEEGLEEVLETDEIHEVGLKSLLAPVVLHSKSQSGSKELPHIQNVNGMPVVRFNCFRFWSIHRKTLVPIGRSQNRWERGMGYSKHLDKNSVAKAALNERLKRISSFRQNDMVKVNPDLPQKSNWKSAFHKVISKLTLTDASADAQMHGIVLTGREKEQDIISKFLRSAILSVNSERDNQYEKFSLFVAGPPGTGKTASVNSIISRLRKEQSEGNLPVFDFISLNGMEMKHPFDAYVRLWEAISKNKEKKPPGIAAGKLERMFTGTASPNEQKCKEPKSRRNAVVVLLDEIDYLVTRKQTVLYNFFDWPIRATKGTSSAQLIVIGISNTLNLPEQLNPSVRSRLGMDRCIFGAYNEEESIQILKSRLEVANESTDSCIQVFEPDAIKFAAKKIAAISGDIRKAFQLCKAAAESVFSELENGKRKPSQKGYVSIKDVQKASREMFSTIIHKAVSFATAFEALLLVCVASLKRQSGRSEGGFNINDVMVKMEGVACALGDQRYLPVPSFGELLGILNRLGEAKVVSLQSAHGKNGFYGVSGAENTRISLQLEDYEIIGALKDTVHCKLAETYLTGSRF